VRQELDPNPDSKVRPGIWKILLLLAVTLLSYSSAMKGGYIWDDDMYVTENKTLTTASGLARIWTEPSASPQYYPLVLTTFWLERHIWGLNPFGYHLTNVLLHACVAMLLYLLLLNLEVPGAWLAALVFAVHPVNVETAAWISERKNLLSSFFYMLSAIMLLRFLRIGRWSADPNAVDPRSFFPREEGSSSGHHETRKKQSTKGVRGACSSKAVHGPRETQGEESTASCFHFLRVFASSREKVTLKSTASAAGPDGNRRLYYCVGLALFVCALLSKTVTCTLPAALLIVLWWKRGRITKNEVVSLAPLFAVGTGMGLMTAWLERTHVGASGADWGLSFAERFLVAGRALCFYAGKLLWPSHLSFNYERWAVNGGVWWQYLYPLAVAAVLLALWMARSRIGRGPIAATLFFAASLFPALGFFDAFPFRYSYVADHFQYIASIGPITLLVAGACWYVSKHYRQRLRLFTGAALLVVAILAVLTWRQGNIYADTWTLWNETLKSNPDSVLAHNNLGSLISKQGKHQEAIAHFSESLRIRPDMEMTHYNMGVELATLGQVDEAIEHYEEALKLRPDFDRALNNLGSLLAQKGRIEDAVHYWTRAVEIKPDYIGARCNLLIGYTQLGDFLAARREYGRIKALDPALAVELRHMVQGLE